MKKFIIAAVTAFFAIQSAAYTEIQLPDMGDSAGALVSPIQEYQVGQSFFWQLQQQVDLIEDPEINDYIRSLGSRLAATSDAPNLPFTFFMVPNSTINAFAAPGGFIGIHSGLMTAAESEGELASVMAHEIAHVTQRHILRSYERRERMSVPMTAAMVAAALLGLADPNAGVAAIMAVQGGSVQMQIDYTRAHEAEADNLGMQNLVRAGFDPMAMPRFFERLQVAGRFYGGRQIPEFLRTHPVTSSRIAETRSRAESYRGDGKFRDSEQFYLMREKLIVMAADNTRELVQDYQNRLEADTDENKNVLRYGYALALTKAGHHNQAKEVLLELTNEDEDKLTYQLALADVEIALGRLPAALAIYEDNQRLYPDDRGLTIKQVQALLRANQPTKAISLLQSQLEIGESSRELYRLLARAYGDAGNRVQSHSWLAEYYYSSGRLAGAVDQLRIAAEHARGDEYELAKISARLRNVETQLAELENLR